MLQTLFRRASSIVFGARPAFARRGITIGVPYEVKSDEYRVGLIPASVDLLVKAGHQVTVETKAGEGSGILDQHYTDVGAKIAKTAEEAWDNEMIIKVKEPLPEEYGLIDSQVLFTYFHFGADRKFAETMLSNNSVCIAYETVQLKDGSLPLLIPMSEVAGRMAVQEGAKYLERPLEGRGRLLAGVPGVPSGNVLVIGGGIVGYNAARISAGLGASVVLMDTNVARMRHLSTIMPNNVMTIYSTPHELKEQLRHADVVIGAVYTVGETAPKLITREHLSLFRERAVFIDVSIDQGGIAETSKPTTHSKPTYSVDNVNHYCVGNIPGAVPNTSTYALNNATLSFALELANLGWKDAVKANPALKLGVNKVGDTIAHAGVAKSFPDLPFTDVEKFL